MLEVEALVQKVLSCKTKFKKIRKSVILLLLLLLLPLPLSPISLTSSVDVSPNPIDRNISSGSSTSSVSISTVPSGSVSNPPKLPRLSSRVMEGIDCDGAAAASLGIDAVRPA